MYKASLSRKAWQQRSMPSLRDFGPGSQTVAANVARAKMNRSVASVLRAAEEAEPPVGTPTPLMVGRTPTPLPLGERRLATPPRMWNTGDPTWDRIPRGSIPCGMESLRNPFHMGPNP